MAFLIFFKISFLVIFKIYLTIPLLVLCYLSVSKILELYS